MRVIDIRADYKIHWCGGNTSIPGRAVGWGNHINFLEWRNGESTQRIYGHKTPKPRNGDVIQAAMESGRIALFVISDLECPSDPPDMFFANASFVGYEDENPLPEAQ